MVDLADSHESPDRLTINSDYTAAAVVGVVALVVVADFVPMDNSLDLDDSVVLN